MKTGTAVTTSTFAHHEDQTIRLAYSDHLTGPWQLYEPGALHINQSRFPTVPPKIKELHPIAKKLLDQGDDGTYPHIASPDIVIDEATQTIRMYYHGRTVNGLQLTRMAVSKDGLSFVARGEVLGRPYMRIFQHDGHWFGIAMPGFLYHSKNGLNDFKEGPNIFPHITTRHYGLLKQKNKLLIFWTEIGDSPEQLKLSSMNLTDDWTNWKISNTVSLRKPTRQWEGANLPIEPSKFGAIFQPVNQLRDPAVYTEDGQIFILYSVAGEQGIGIAQLQS